ncbi:MAG: hypothetical protein ABIC91_06320 [Nanoarchaeota archaeon]|nr:hypothetical protein [Nanoarchaeota archaeon]MBU1030389.1 hypothetical protein [Nanoarchaeota archaeon]
MKIGIAGPTRIKEFCETLKLKKIDYFSFLENIGKQIALTGHELVVVPAQTNAPGIIAKAYKNAGGKRIIGIIPTDDDDWGLLDVEPSLADEIITCGTWRNQPEKLCEESDVLLVVGYSPGAMIEICYTKWFKVKKVLIVKNYISAKLHPEIEKDLDLEYIEKTQLMKHDFFKR